MGILKNLTKSINLLISNSTDKLKRKKQRKRDIQLMDKIKNKDKTALAELYRLYSTKIASSVIPLMKDKNLTNEIVQDTFMSVWQKAEQFDSGRGDVYWWILANAKNRALGYWRKQNTDFKKKEQIKQINTVKSELQKGSQTDLHILNQQKKCLIQAIETISSEQKEAVEMCFFEGHSHIEAAKELGIPLGTLKTRVRLGLSKIGQILRIKLDLSYLTKKFNIG